MAMYKHHLPKGNLSVQHPPSSPHLSLHMIHSPFPLFFINASSPPNFSSISFAFSLVLSFVLGLEMVAYHHSQLISPPFNNNFQEVGREGEIEDRLYIQRLCWRCLLRCRGCCPWGWIAWGCFLRRYRRRFCRRFGMP